MCVCRCVCVGACVGLCGKLAKLVVTPIHAYIQYSIHTRPVARGGGVGGGGRTTPPVAHPKDFVPPFSNFVPPFSNFVPPFSNFVPPWNMWMTSRGQCPRGGGCAWCSTHPSSDPPPPGWLATGLHTFVYIHTVPTHTCTWHVHYIRTLHTHTCT